MTQYKALGDSVILQVEERTKQTQTASGLLLIQDPQSISPTVNALVLDVGPGKWCDKTGSYIPTGIKVGDTVLISISTGVELDKTHRMVRTDDVFAVLVKDFKL
ncbi:Co-chaperone GroES [Xanthomonas phage Xoo-sp13]|nr:Co-chaperone GroES [Xanthomonas phage Xoo-sp13]